MGYANRTRARTGALDMNIAAPFPGFSARARPAAIARFHGLELSEPYLLQLASPGPDGRVTAVHLAQVANKVGLTARLVDLSWRRLGGLGKALPAILILRSGGAGIVFGLKEAAAA